MLILERSFPMFLQSKFHKFTPAVEDIGTGSFDRLPVLDNELDFDPVSSKRTTKFMFGYILSCQTLKVLSSLTTMIIYLFLRGYLAL